jgi:phage head maturation protease
MTLATSIEVVLAVEAGLINEMSFAFMISRGSWSPDYLEYRIHEYDIDRGDVSPVTYGANPATDIGVRSAEEPQLRLSSEQERIARSVLAAPLLRTR